MIIDVNLTFGRWAFRPVNTGSFLEMTEILTENGIEYGCVSSLNAVLYRNCTAGDNELLKEMENYRAKFLYIATINPEYAGWERDLDIAVNKNHASGIRIYPNYHNFLFKSEKLGRLLGNCRKDNLPVMLTVGIEDDRQRHFLDTAPDITGAQIRYLVQNYPENLYIITNGRYDLIQEVFFGLPEKLWQNIYFDTTWIFGPPLNHLKKLIGQVGINRFLFGSHFCLRIPGGAKVNVDMLELKKSDQDRLFFKNALHLFPEFYKLQV